MQSANKKIKLSGKQEEDMKKPLSKINEDPEAYRTMFSGPTMYNEDLKHINPQDPIAAEKESVAKRTAEEAFDKVYSLKKSIRELEGIFNFLNLLFY